MGLTADGAEVRPMEDEGLARPRERGVEGGAAGDVAAGGPLVCCC